MAGRFAVRKGALFDAIEVCDRCGLRARVRVLLSTGRELYLCGQHARKHRAALKRTANLQSLPY